MLRPLLVAAILALAMPVHASPGLAEADDALPGGGTVRHEVGSAFGQADPALWFPILREQGYVAAARAATGTSAAQGGMVAIGAPVEEKDRVEHWFMPLGDVNANGRDDVVLATFAKEDLTYQAIDGGRVDEVLWTLKLKPGEFAYVAGDVDEDGVYDLEKYEDASSSADEDGRNFEQSVTFSYLNGRDLAPLSTLQLQTKAESESSEPDGPVAVAGTYSEKERWSFEFAYDADGLPGFHRQTLSFQYEQSQERVLFFTTSESYSENHTYAYALLDVAGALVWSFDQPGWMAYADEADITGDGVGEVVAARAPDFRYAVSNMPQVPVPVQPPAPLPVDPPVPTPWDEEEVAAVPFQLQVLDGANGKQLWTRSFDNVSEADTWWLGDLYGSGPVLAASFYTVDEDGYESSTATLLLDGRNGETLREVDVGDRGLRPLGDADHDGLDDAILLDFNDSTLGFEAVTGDMDSLWTAKVKDDDFAGLVDITGDDVRDLLSIQDKNVSVVSGTNGKTAWTRGDARMHDLDFVSGIAKETDVDLGFLLSDAKEFQNMSEYPADVLMMRGSDGAPLWLKPMYDPKDYAEVSGDDVYLSIGSAGDLNGDGANDLIVSLEQFNLVFIDCDDDGCTAREESDDDPGQPISITALVDGATGATYARFDDMELSPSVKAVRESSVDVKAAGEELASDDGTIEVPGFGLVSFVAAVAVALALRRKPA